MKVGLYAFFTTPFATPHFIETLGQATEECGLDSIWVPDTHAVTFDEYASRNPYSEDGKMVGPPLGEGDLEPFPALGFLAAKTSRIRLGTFCVLPQRNPVYAAKEVTTLDHLSKGRIDFGVG